jgi:HSP20 family protein
MADTSPENSGVPPVERVRHEVDRWLEVVRSTGERAMETLGITGLNRPSAPLVDIIELPQEVVVQIELPGIAAEAVELSLAGNMLTVGANRAPLELPCEAKFHLRERVVGKFQRSIPLPIIVDDSAIKAEARDGLLTVTLRKATSTIGRSIPISTGS